MTAESPQDWSFATAREPASFAAAVDPAAPEVEHAMAHDRTLCDIDGEQVVVYRHHFYPDRLSACPACRLKAAAAPTQPSTQEQLHNKVLSATVSPLRDHLIAALRRGAHVRKWINGPAQGASRYAGLDHITEGHDALASALLTNDRVGVAEVEDPAGNFIIVLPDSAPPVIGRISTP